MNNSNRIRNIVSAVVLLLVLIIATSLIANAIQNTSVKYSDVLKYFKDEQVLIQRIRFSTLPALSFVPDARAPPNG